MMLDGDQSILYMGSLNVLAYSCRLDNVSHTHINPLLSPVAKYSPVGETAIEMTGEE